MPPEPERTRKILAALKAAYPVVRTQLDHTNAFELLISTILSAQCTDKQVNSVTPGLFAQYKTPEEFAKAPLSQLEKRIRSTGFFHNKAKNIRNCAKTLVERHKGVVPDTLEELVKLPGVGRKTANVVLGAAFGIPGMVVDTHVARISKRLGFTDHKDPYKIELDLMEIVPKADWNDFSLWLIYFGRQICSARKPACPDCFIQAQCPFPDKNLE